MIEHFKEIQSGNIVELREHRFMMVIKPNNDDGEGILKDADGYFGFNEFYDDFYFKGSNRNNDIIRVYKVTNPRGYECIWQTDIQAFIDCWPDWFNLIWRDTDFSKDKEKRHLPLQKDHQTTPQLWDVNFVKLEKVLTHLNEKTAIINRNTGNYDDETIDIEKEIRETFKF